MAIIIICSKRLSGELGNILKNPFEAQTSASYLDTNDLKTMLTFLSAQHVP